MNLLTVRTLKESLLGRRPSQQDCIHTCELGENIFFSVVCDGHGDHGHTASQLATKVITEVLTIELEAAAKTGNVERFKAAPQYAIDCAHQAIVFNKSGTTVSLIIYWLDEDLLVTAQLGDSPIALLGVDGELDWFLGHTAQVEEERLRVKNQGGIVDWQGYISLPDISWGLAVTRCLGDIDLDKILSRTAEVQYLSIANYEGTLIASDGILACKMSPKLYRDDYMPILTRVVKDSFYCPQLTTEDNWPPLIPIVASEILVTNEQVTSEMFHDNVSLVRTRLRRS